MNISPQVGPVEWVFEIISTWQGCGYGHLLSSHVPFLGISLGYFSPSPIWTKSLTLPVLISPGLDRRWSECHSLYLAQFSWHDFVSFSFPPDPKNSRADHGVGWAERHCRQGSWGQGCGCPRSPGCSCSHRLGSERTARFFLRGPEAEEITVVWFSSSYLRFNQVRGVLTYRAYFLIWLTNLKKCNHMWAVWHMVS